MKFWLSHTYQIVSELDFSWLYRYNNVIEIIWQELRHKEWISEEKGFGVDSTPLSPQLYSM